MHVCSVAEAVSLVANNVGLYIQVFCLLLTLQQLSYCFMDSAAIYELVFLLLLVSTGQLLWQQQLLFDLLSFFEKLIHVHCNNTVLCFVCTFVLFSESFCNLIFYTFYSFSISVLFQFRICCKGKKVLNKKCLMCLYKFKEIFFLIFVFVFFIFCRTFMKRTEFLLS